jgi:hypothetical protein
LEDKKIIFEKEYMTRLTATDLLIAGTTINAGDTITLRANDVDSFGSSSPVDESITYDGSDILTHNFTKASYQYWRLSVNSGNVVDIGYLYLGESYSTPYIGVNLSDGHNTDTVKTRTPRGNTYGDIRNKYKTRSIKWPYVSVATDKPALIEAFNNVDISKPFFITFDETNIGFGTIYCTIDGAGLFFEYLINPAYVEASLNIIEEL